MLLVAAALLAADLGGLTLAAKSPQRQMLVGEPLKLTLRWRASRPVRDVAVEGPDFLFQSVLLSVDDGSGPRHYREHPHQIVEKTLVTRSFATGDEELVNLVFYRGGYLDRPGGEGQPGPLFPAPGEYAVTARYIQDGVPSRVVSNTLRFKVSEPAGADREIFGALRRDPRLVSADGTAESQALVRDLLERHPDSPYLALAKLARLREQGSALHNERDPVTGESVHHLGQEGLADFRRQHYRRLAEQLLADDAWGPFEEEALALASLYAQGAGDAETSARARKDLFARHPRSATVKRIKEREARAQ